MLSEASRVPENRVVKVLGGLRLSGFGASGV